MSNIDERTGKPKMKFCNKCKTIKPTDMFCKESRHRDKLTSRCRKCINEDNSQRYIKYRERYIKNGRASRSRRKYKIKIFNAKKYKDTLIELHNVLGNTCMNCGISDKRVLQVDHVNGDGGKERKNRSAGYYFYKLIIDKLKNGSTDYKLLCANCHLIENIEKGYKKSIWEII
jgi:hypothetical protein